jgi:hypothetical protein
VDVPVEEMIEVTDVAAEATDDVVDVGFCKEELEYLPSDLCAKCEDELE